MATKLTCEKCGKVIEGLTEGQANWNMQRHKDGKGCKKASN